MSLADVLGLLALILETRRRNRRAALLLGFVLLSSLPYALVQPVPRYTFPIYLLLSFPAGALAAAQARRAWALMLAAGATRRPQSA